MVVTDDLDGSPDAVTVAFGFDGNSYEIDLSEKNRVNLEKALQPFIDAGRRTAHRRAAKISRANGRGGDLTAVRAWAAGQGLKVSQRGRISAEVMSRYEAVH